MDRVILVNTDNYATEPIIEMMREYSIEVSMWNRPAFEEYDISVYDDLVDFARSQKIYIVVFVSAIDIAPTSEDAIEVLEYMQFSTLYCYVLDVPGRMYKPSNIKMYDFTWTFDEYVDYNGIHLDGKKPEYIESIRKAYELHKKRSKIAIDGGYGHRKGEPLVHHDKAEKMEYIIENHKGFGGSMNGKQVMESYREKTGNTFSRHTLIKYIAELRSQIDEDAEPVAH